MKNKIIIGIAILIILFLSVLLYFSIRNKKEEEKIKNAVIEITLIEDLNVEFNSELRVKDLIKSINGKIINNFKINTTKLGEQEIEYTYINDDNIRLKQKIKYNVVDTVEPIIWLSGSYTIYKGNAFDYSNIMCGDNHDSIPNCYVEGKYDVNKVGSYPLVFKAEDKSGNVATKEFVLKVVNKPTGSSTTQSTSKTYTKFSDILSKHKTENTKIGIDVSGWQGEIDFEKIKNAGVEFIIIRVGGNTGTEKENYVDSKFIRNIELANEYDIDVGLYFYSYANSKEHAIRDAKWLLEQIKDYDVELPIAFDWENWNYYNFYELSFYELTEMAEAFLDVLEEAGYKGMLYSSKNYLEKIWLKTDYPIWLAHYTTKTNYEGPYYMWQLCDNGQIDGINGAVDIDVMYLN